MTANNLLEARKNAGLTQQHLGELLGVNRATIRRWETGESKMPLDMATKIAHALGVSTDALMTTENKKAPADMAGEGDGTRRKISMEDWIRVPIVSREWTACCGNGISAAEITNMDEGFVLVDRAKFYRFDDMRRPGGIRRPLIKLCAYCKYGIRVQVSGVHFACPGPCSPLFPRVIISRVVTPDQIPASKTDEHADHNALDLALTDTRPPEFSLCGDLRLECRKLPLEVRLLHPHLIAQRLERLLPDVGDLLRLGPARNSVPHRGIRDEVPVARGGPAAMNAQGVSAWRGSL